MASEQSDSIKLIDSFIDTIWLEKGLSINTLSAYRSDLSNFLKWLNNKDLLGVSKTTLLDYLAFRLREGYSSKSTARCLSSLRAFYSYLLVKNNLKESNFFSDAFVRTN